jgi:hypothetical protein
MSSTPCMPSMSEYVNTDNTSSLDFGSESADEKSFLSKKVLPVVKKIGNVAGNVATISGKIATIASVL